tara:strand:- start:4849 stop:6102 length:1254 start_codon:yes stop_codon:yes gene_type:complete
MANGINSLLALGSLEGAQNNLKKKKKTPQSFYNTPFEEMKPINTNLEGNMGGNNFGEPIQQQPSLNIQSPSQMSASLQIDAIGGQAQGFSGMFGPDQAGDNSGFTGGGSYGDIDPNDTGATPPAGGFSGAGSEGAGGFNGYQPFSTSQESLFSSFFGGLQDPYRSQITSATGADSEGGAALSLKELADLAGFDTSKLSATDYEALRKAGILQFANYMEGTGEQLQNLQSYRTMLLDTATKEGTFQVGGLLGMVEEESASGLQSGRQSRRGKQARKSLRDAMKTQLLGGEEAYQSELDSLRGSVVGGLQEGLANIADSVIGLNADLGTKLKDYSYQDPTMTGGATTENYTGGVPGNYQSVYNQYDISNQDMGQIQGWISSQFAANGSFPTSDDVKSYITGTLGYRSGSDEEQQEGDYY